MNRENQISKSKNILLDLWDKGEKPAALENLIAGFCGTVISDFSEARKLVEGKKIYAVGNIALLHEDVPVAVVAPYASNYENKANISLINAGQVPIIVHNAGVYFKNLFGKGNYFNKVRSEHEFQELTESNKASKALRKGIYLTRILKDEDENLHFRLLRCSSNLTGPTDNFRKTDQYIMSTLNDAANSVFEIEPNLNHVLAQIYQNKKKDDAKEVKAKIKAHSDKTKDMPKEGLIAFCTFYDQENFNQLSPSETDPYDWCYKGKSGLTRLLFKLKSSAENPNLVKEFSVTLYPNSAFLIPLSTNRLYTHEIRPSALNIDKIPTRMGYVARCSNLDAVYMNDQTYIKENDQLIKLEEMTQETMGDLRNSYYEENETVKVVNYGKVHFSMNSGDYEKPLF